MATIFDKIKFVNDFKKFREINSLSFRDIYKVTGVSIGSISRLENMKGVEFDNVLKLSDFANLDVTKYIIKIQNESVCSCEMTIKIKSKLECWRCGKPLKELLRVNKNSENYKSNKNDNGGSSCRNTI